jgi:hypothetical protein
VSPDREDLLASIECDLIILAQLALSANREARFNALPQLREALEIIVLQTKEIARTFNQLNSAPETDQ